MNDTRLLLWTDPFLTLNNTNNYPIVLNHYIYNEYENTAIHKHDYIEMTYVINGKGIHIIDGEIYDVSKGHICIVNENVPHSLFPTDPQNEGNLAVFNCMFKKEYFINLLLRYMKEEGIFNGIITNEEQFMMFQDDSVYRVSALFENLFHEFTFKRSYTREMLDLLSVQIFIMLNRLYLREADSTSSSIILSGILSYIGEHYNEKVDISMLAQSVNLSKSYLSVLFKKYTGFSIIEYLQKKRIDHACNHIIKGDGNFRDIAFKVGYNDYSFFLKTFKKIVGMTPREFKALHS